MDKMNDSLKKLLVIVSVSVIIFWIFKPKGNSEDQGNSLFGGGSSGGKIKKPTLPEEQMQDETIRTAYEALCAYIDASNEGQSQAVLDSISQDFKDKMGLVIYKDAGGKLAVKDVEGNDILVNG